MDQTDRIATIPLFPLPQVVLFEDTLLPLHVFEPRYRTLMKDLLDQRGWIGMALLKPGWEADYAGRPPVRDVIGVGEVMSHQQTEDGRYYLLLHGIGRVRILSVDDSRAYRMAQCAFEPVAETTDDARIETLLPCLFRLLKLIIEAQRLSLPLPAQDLAQSPLPARRKYRFLINLFCTTLSKTPQDKQRLLEMPSLEQRLNTLAEEHELREISAVLRTLEAD